MQKLLKNLKVVSNEKAAYGSFQVVSFIFWPSTKTGQITIYANQTKLPL